MPGCEVNHYLSVNWMGDCCYGGEGEKRWSPIYSVGLFFGNIGVDPAGDRREMVDMPRL